MILCTIASAAYSQERHDPVADPRAVVRSGSARFTILTPHLVRLEWAANGEFEDRASLVFVVRRLPVPHFTTRREGGWLVIETHDVSLRYLIGSGRFDARNLEVRCACSGRRVVWHPGLRDTANLGGTIRTLDGAAGAVPLEPGLLSRDGWVLVDDSQRPLLDASDWPWVVPRPPAERQDWYFFGYGHDYTAALGDFAHVAGPIPMPPRFAFGAWWSRYWAYTDRELMQLVGEYDEHDVPLDVLVVDMDWHETLGLRWGSVPNDQAGQPRGWTGYTWNHAYFPDPEGFLQWADQRGLKVPLNLHPASGIQPHEATYTTMARAMGIDPATKRYVPFAIEDKRFAAAYFANVIHPLEGQGVAFWWLDWQQGSETTVPGLTPTWWLNYVFFTDMARQDRARPLLLHRYGGLGNHRYEIGFSGDAFSTWSMLAFEPEFTATASNVLYGYWSHDIGGHQPKELSPELYTRWVQFGALSPILRTHATKEPGPAGERRIWAYPPEYFAAMRDAFRLRYALIPYIYTAAREAYETGVAPLRPLYYAYPEANEAYAFRGEYFFGDDLLVCPITAPLAPDTLLASVRVWLPPGDWIEWFTGTRLAGPAVLTRRFALDEIPLYARAGAIIPMQQPPHRSSEQPLDPLVLTVFPGDSGSARLYEDAANSSGYERGEFAWTTVRQRRRGREIHITVSPAEGSYPGMSEERAIEIRLPGVWPPAVVRSNGGGLPFAPSGAAPGWRYDGDRLTAIVSLPRSSVHQTTDVVLVEPDSLDAALLDGVPGAIARLKRAMHLLEGLWPQDWPSDTLVALAQTGRRITLDPSRAPEEVARLRAALPRVETRIAESTRGDTALIARALAHLRAP